MLIKGRVMILEALLLLNFHLNWETAQKGDPGDRNKLLCLPLGALAVSNVTT